MTLGGFHLGSWVESRQEPPPIPADVGASRTPASPLSPLHGDASTHTVDIPVAIESAPVAAGAAALDTPSSPVAHANPANAADNPSDSDSDSEYYRLALEGDEARRKKREAEEAAAAAAAAAAAEEEARRKSKKKKRAASSDSSSSSSDDDEASVGGKKKVASPATKKKKDRCADSSTDSDGDLDAHLEKTRRDEEARRPRNPLALQRAEEEKFASLARAKSAKTQDHRRRKKKDGSGSDSDDDDDDDSIADAGGAAKAAAAKAEDDDDDFFSDAEQCGPDGGTNESSDDDQKKRKKWRAKSSPRGVKRGASSASSGSRAKSAAPRSKSSSSSAGAKKKPPAKKKNDTEDEDEKVGYDVDMEELSDEDEDLENRLKPAFAKPKFAVGALEPLEMTVTNIGKVHTTNRCMIESDIEITRHYVPASINRYLQPYQREGIQFMHKIITDQKTPRGCILGDGERSLAYLLTPHCMYI